MSQRQTSTRGQSGAPRSGGRGALGAIAGLFGSAVAGTVRAGARRPAVVLASVAVIGGAGVFSWNATMKQTAQHPAPLFAGTKPAPAKPEPPRRAEPASPLTTGTTRADVPVPPPRPSGPDAIGSIIRAAEAPAKPGERIAEPKPKAEPKKVADAKPAEPKKAAEAKAGEAKAKPGPASAEAKPSSQQRIASAQKALAKLGYGPIAADGIMGAGTRQALEKFEREKNIPVTGAVQGRTAKKLASLSGIAIE